MNILDTIVAQKRLEVATLPTRPLAPRQDARDFIAALRRPRVGELALIAEVKKASPSAGVIRADFDPVRIAKDYEAGGASCLSVLTDEKFFQGSLDYLRQIRSAVSLPLLRKDFIIDERQIAESLEAGADAILLIVAILTDEELRQFSALAAEARLAALVEVHDAAELDRALAAGATLIGVNNRDLKTFRVDLATTEKLAAGLGKRIEDRGLRIDRPSSGVPLSSILSPLSSTSGVTLVAESGIHTRADVARLRRCGAHAMLVGEALMREADIVAKVKELLGAGVV